MGKYFVLRDREYPFCEDLITDEAGVADPQLPVLAKVSSLLDILRLSESYEHVEQLWKHFSLTASCINFEVCWSCEEILVNIRICSVKNMYWFRKITCLFRVSLGGIYFRSIPVNRMFPGIHSRNVGWAKAYGQFRIDFEEGFEDTFVFVRTWDRDTFRRVCVAVLSKYGGQASRILGRLLSVVASSVSLVALGVGSHLLLFTFIEFVGSGYRENLVEYPVFDLLSLNRCFQKCASVVFGSLDPV